MFKRRDINIKPTLSISHSAPGLHRSTAAQPRLLTLSVFPAQFSVEVFDDPRQFLLLRLARRFVWDGDVKEVQLVFRLSRLNIVPEVHNTAAAAAAATSAAGRFL